MRERLKNSFNRCCSARSSRFSREKMGQGKTNCDKSGLKNICGSENVATSERLRFDFWRYRLNCSCSSCRKLDSRVFFFNIAFSEVCGCNISFFTIFIKILRFSLFSI
uniref:(northern house mosquito) hypothetical protein n=1 Tax=Culex pipiens TaxID=7175 RepID=A0A8D8CU99_CULPI